MFEKKNVSEHNFKTQINKSKNHCDDFLYIHISEKKGFGKFFNSYNVTIILNPFSFVFGYGTTVNV